MQASIHLPINFPALPRSHKYTRINFKFTQPICCCIHSIPKIESLHAERFKIAAFGEKLSFPGLSAGTGRYGASAKRVVVVKFNDRGFNGLGGGGGKINGETTRVLGNVALAIFLTYLTMNGQLGWLIDAIVSFWLIVVIVPIIGIGAFIWWAGRDIVESSCPNCGNEFQVFESTLNDELQLCPFCSQPFSVVDDEFVSDPVMFSNQTTSFGQGFNDFSPRKKGKNSYTGVVDIEAEIRDAD